MPSAATSVLGVRFFLLSLALLWSTAVPAQTSVPATGRVVDKATGAPLPDATVRVEGHAATVTDKAGRFVLPLPAASQAALVFSHLGYQPRTLPAAQLPSGADVALEPQLYQIGEVQVSYVQLRKLLLKTWKLAPESVDGAAQLLLDALRKRDPAKAETLAKRPEAVRRVMEMARYDFRDDGTVKTKLLLFGQKHRWQLNEETRTLIIADDEGHEAQRAVTDLTDTRLVLGRPGSDTPPIVYVPAD